MASRAAAASRPGHRRSGLWSRLQDRAGSRGEKIVYVRMFSAPCEHRAGAGRSARRSEGDRDRGLRRRLDRSTRLRVRRRDREAVFSRIPGGRRDRHTTPRSPASPLRATDPGTRWPSPAPARPQCPRVALAQLADQDPLINVRQDDIHHEISVSLFARSKRSHRRNAGDRLRSRRHLPQTNKTIYIERPTAREPRSSSSRGDESVLRHHRLRFDPAPIGSGVSFRLDVDPRDLPVYIYKTSDNFIVDLTQYIWRTLQEGLHGWPVPDCAVTMTECGYYVGDGPKSAERAHAAPRPPTFAS